MRLIDGGRLLIDYCKANCGKIPDNEEVCPNCHAAQMIADAPTIDPESLRPKWISVEDRLPEYDQAVLCYKSDRGVRFGKVLAATYADGVQAFMDCERKYAFGATHWTPLPEPPGADMRGDT